MAQRQRAGLITPRSLDRNGLPVLTVVIFHFILLLFLVSYSIAYNIQFDTNGKF